MKTQRLQAAFARKREAEHIRSERTAATLRYFDHWGKVTSKFSNWTTPEYYEKADENLRKVKEKKEKEKLLNERREKLQQMLMREKTANELEVAVLSKPKSRHIATDTMEKIDENYKATLDQRRKLELEAKLYGRWRHGVDDDGLLFESKSNNQVLAKLNWLDKQIDEQVKREQEEKIAQERALRIQEERRKTEEHFKERQIIREKEIKEVRALQERHVEELKEREKEADYLKEEAYCLENAIDYMKAELRIIDERLMNPDFQAAAISHNLKRVKMVIRTRSNAFKHQLEADINLLHKLDKICPDQPDIQQLIEKLKKQHDVEMLNLTHVENMYESEAKTNLNQCEEAWRQLSTERNLDLRNLIKDLQNELSRKYHENQIRQKDLIDIRSTHLSSIENSNERLKLLINEQQQSPRAAVAETTLSEPQPLSQPVKSVSNVSDSFINLNLDCLGGEGGSQPQTARSQTVISPDSDRIPKFRRKKVAWL